MRQKNSLKPFFSDLIRKAEKEFIPISMQFELSHSCNLNCLHCFMPLRDTDKEELSTPEVCYILDQLAGAGCLFLTFTGGEIFTREDFFIIARYARQKNFALRLFTNGTLITPEVADKVADLCPLSVEVSVYGVSPEVHDSITRVPGSFEKTMKALRLLEQRNISIALKTPVMKKNVVEYRQVAEMTERLGASFVCDPKIIPKTDSSEDTLSLRIDDQDLHEVVSAFGRRGLGKSTSRDSRRQSYLCATGKRTGCISSYGDVFPCALWRIKVGSLREQTFREIWQDSQLLSDIRFLKLADLSECANCKFLLYCSPCVGLGISENHKLTCKSSMTCSIAEIKKSIVEEERINSGRERKQV